MSTIDTHRDKKKSTRRHTKISTYTVAFIVYIYIYVEPLLVRVKVPNDHFSPIYNTAIYIYTPKYNMTYTLFLRYYFRCIRILSR